MQRTNETSHIECNQNCKCRCRFDASVCNNKQHGDKDKCRCECKELIGKGRCNKGFIWNPSMWEYESDKSCELGEYLDYKILNIEKKIADKLIEEWSENNDGNKMIYNAILIEKVCYSCTIFVLLLLLLFILLIICKSIGSAFFLFWLVVKKKQYLY